MAEPRWLWLALLGPLVLVLLQRYAALARRRQLARLAAPEFVRELTRSHSHLRRGLKNGFLVLAVAGMGFAMARPQWGQQSEKCQAVGHDVVFILDCSRSMLATDVLPNRRQRAKLAILDFVQHQAHGRVGLVAFAGQAFLQCPLTFDYGAFSEALTGIDDQSRLRSDSRWIRGRLQLASPVPLRFYLEELRAHCVKRETRNVYQRRTRDRQ